MSEALLKAILRLFAVVANEGEVTQQERDQIMAFLREHLSRQAVETYIKLFDEYSRAAAVSSDTTSMKNLCQEINAQLTQKQKIVIVLELINIIQADGEISAGEEKLLQIIADTFKISDQDISAIKTFVLGNQQAELDH